MLGAFSAYYYVISQLVVRAKVPADVALVAVAVADKGTTVPTLPTTVSEVTTPAIAAHTRLPLVLTVVAHISLSCAQKALVGLLEMHWLPTRCAL